MIGKPTAI